MELIPTQVEGGVLDLDEDSFESLDHHPLVKHYYDVKT